MNKLNEIEIKKMIGVAKEARNNAFLVNSNHPVGACILTMEGELYGGCNVENIISGLGICAERAAIDHAVIHGKYGYKAIAVVDDGEITFPCGACRQYLALFGEVNNIDIEVVVADVSGKYKVKKLSELLPNKFMTNTKEKLEKIRSYKDR